MLQFYSTNYATYSKYTGYGSRRVTHSSHMLHDETFDIPSINHAREKAKLSTQPAASSGGAGNGVGEPELAARRRRRSILPRCPLVGITWGARAETRARHDALLGGTEF